MEKINQDIEVWLQRMKEFLEDKAKAEGFNLDLIDGEDTDNPEEAYLIGNYQQIMQTIQWFDDEYLTFDPVECLAYFR